MQSVDTNVLIRILVDDTKQMEQVKLARQFAKKAQKLFITQIVQVELIWVLEAAYKLDKTEVLRILNHLNTNDAFVLHNNSQYEMALHLYQTHQADFSDCLILAESTNHECNVVSFDKKFGKLPKVHCLGS